MGTVADVVADLRAGISPVSEGTVPDPGEFGVLELSAVTRGQICRARAKRLPPALVQADWPRIRQGTILVCRASGNRALVGACTLATDDFPTLIPPDTAWVVNVKDHYPASVLLEYLQSVDGRRAIDRIAHGTNGTWKISQKSFMSLPLPETSNAERVAIAGLSVAFDTQNRTLDNFIAEKQVFRRGLAEQLLTGERRFPEFRTAKWSTVSLGELFQSKSEANVANDPLLVYSCTKTVGIVPQAERFSKRLASTDLSRYKVVSPGDLVYDPMLLWDGSIGFVPDRGRGVVSPAYETFSVREGLNRDYLRTLLKSHRLLYLYKKISRGTNTRRRKAMADDFLNLRVPMPSAGAERDRIATCLVAAQREIDLLKEQADLYTRYKRGLMSRLFSGEIQVPA